MASARVLLGLAILLAGACGGSPPDAAGPTETPSIPATESPAPSPVPTPDTDAPAPPPPPPGPVPTDCGPVAGGGPADAQLVDVRVGTHDGYDRLVFEFEGTGPPSPAGVVPAYTVTRAAEPLQDPSGAAVPVAGAAVYAVVVQGASGVDLSGEEPVVTYDGPRELRPGFPMLVEAQAISDFERVLEWGVGLNAPRCARATELTDPLRLVLDFPH